MFIEGGRSNAARAHWSWEEKHRLEVSRQGAGSGAVLWRTCIYSNSECSVQGVHKSVFTSECFLHCWSSSLRGCFCLSGSHLEQGKTERASSSFLFCFEVSLCLTQGPCHCIYYLPDTGISVFLSINGLNITRCLCQALLREITLFGLSAARKSWRNLAVRNLRLFLSFCTRFPKSTSHFLLTLCFLI